MNETGIKHRAILASENLTEILLSLKLNAMHDRLETMLDMCGTAELSTSTQNSSLHRLKIPHFSGSVVSLLLR